MRTLWLVSSAALSAFVGAPAAAAGLEATPATGRILVHAFKKGLFAGFAHDHHFEVTRWRVTADVPEGDPSRLSVEAILAAGSLRDRQGALSDADRDEVDAKAAGPDVLDAAHHPEIAWRSEGVVLDPEAGKDGRVRGTIHGRLTMHGQTRPVDVAFEAQRLGGAWDVRGTSRARQSHFGISPFSGFAGTVGVKDEVEIEIALTLRPGPPAGSSLPGSPSPRARIAGPDARGEAGTAPDSGAIPGLVAPDSTHRRRVVPPGIGAEPATGCRYLVLHPAPRSRGGAVGIAGPPRSTRLETGLGPPMTPLREHPAAAPSPGGDGTGSPARRGRGALAALSRTLAFDLAAPVYSFLTAHEAWRASCRALGELVPGPRVLDLGVGPGTSALEMARGGGKAHLGLDRSAEMLRRAAGAARSLGVSLPLLRADGMALPFRDGALDGVTGHSLLYLLPDPGGALDEVRRVLRLGGRAAFLEPRAGRAPLRAAFAGGARCAASLLLWRWMSRLHARFDEAGLILLLERAGFRRARAWPALAGHGVVATAERVE